MAYLYDNPENEAWKPLVGAEGYYEISNYGRVRSLPRPASFRHAQTGQWTTRPVRGRIMKPYRLHHGYNGVKLRMDGVSKNIKCSCAVAAAFIGPRPRGFVVAHLNGVPADDRPENLRYVTQHENVQHMIGHGTKPLGERCGGSKISDDAARAIKASATDVATRKRLAAAFGISPHNVWNIQTGRTWRHL